MVAAADSPSARSTTDRSLLNGHASTYATPIASATRIAGGHAAPITATSSTIARPVWTRARRSTPSADARPRALTTNGASAKQTSGPSEPCAISFRASGFVP